MSDAIKAIRVPVDLHALVVDEEVIKNWGYIGNAEGDFHLGKGRWWPRPSDYTNVTDWLKSAAPPPFSHLSPTPTTGKNPKGAPTKDDCGIYLHWVSALWVAAFGKSLDRWVSCAAGPVVGAAFSAQWARPCPRNLGVVRR